VPFEAHLELLRWFLSRRPEVVARLAGLLNAQRKPPQSLHDVPLLARQLAECFFGVPGITEEQRALQRQLDDAHRASGFEPRHAPGEPNDLVEPAQLTSRAFHLWQRTRWPGHEGRVRYAQTLFNVFCLRRLLLLSVRIWDTEPLQAGERLAQLQQLLDELWRTSPADQPELVRDARSLLPLALSPTTVALHGYFDVAERIASTLAVAEQVAIAKISVRMAGGHLRSQLRHVSTQQGVPLDAHGLVLTTRRSNALDLATLIQALVPLLEAYEHAVQHGQLEQRLDLADAICQGISPDPELFVNRLELLRPYSMIDYLFVATDANGDAAYTERGRRHVRLLDEYAARIARMAPALRDDCARFRPAEGGYSPYGALYGFSSQLLEHMALKASQPEAETRFAVEDVFVAGLADKRAWVDGWRRLPHVPREVSKLFEYPEQFAIAMFERIERALQQFVAEGAAHPRMGRLLLTSVPDDPACSSIAALPVAYILSSDRRLVAENRAVAVDEQQLLHSRIEGELLVGFATAGGWCAISKDVLTDVLGAGRDARVAALPRAAARALALLCPALVTVT
jgi:hypothetical protein